MGKYPKKYNKEEFIKFLEENKVSVELINRTKELPVSVTHDDVKYDLNIIVTYNTEGNTSYNFELNYYSEKNIEYLLVYKIYNDIEVSLNMIECELMKKNLFNVDANCTK